MDIDRLVVIGGGGHAKVVVDAWLAAGRAPGTVEVRDDDASRVGRLLEGLPVQVPAVPPPAARPAPGPGPDTGFHVAVGSNAVRRDLWARAVAAGLQPAVVVHPRAAVARSAVLEPGCFVAAQAVVGPGARVGRGAIINHGAVVDHDCVVGEFAHVAPMASLSGGAQLGAGSLLGSGARILPGIMVGADATIGAGAVVMHPVGDGRTAVGVPARIIEAQ